MSKALVLLSGGQDSTTALYWAKYHFADIRAITFTYGQRHENQEIDAARTIAEIAKVPLYFAQASDIRQFGNSALLDTHKDINQVDGKTGLPASFVPGRNIFFLTLAGMYAYKFGIEDLVLGVCQTDYSGYPDCRNEFITFMQRALSYGMGKDFTLHTPMMFLTKSEEVKMATEMPGCMDALKYSHTCYEGFYPPCGECPACKLRAKGFEEAGVPDPIYAR
jgi:7-cyano-7-deazaguanine synthase